MASLSSRIHFARLSISWLVEYDDGIIRRWAVWLSVNASSESISCSMLIGLHFNLM
jgi:hypothetical protein